MAENTRLFNGKRYHMIYPDKTTSWPKPLGKREARRIARDERESGRLVRVVKIAGGYGVYVRRDRFR